MHNISKEFSDAAKGGMYKLNRKRTLSIILIIALLIFPGTAEKEVYADRETVEQLTRELSPHNKTALSMIHAVPAWSAFLTYYIQNRQPFEIVNVGIIDTMFDENHGDVHFADVVGNTSAEELKKHSKDADSIHGTHVAGILGAIHRNNLGIDGMYPLANEPYKILKDGTILTKSHIYAVSMLGGVADLTDFKVAFDEMLRRDVKVINISMGFSAEDIKKNKDVYKQIKKGKKDNPFSDNPFPKDYLDQLAEIIQSYLNMGKDFLIVTAAGNDELPTQATNPLAAISKDKYPDVYNRIMVVGNASNKGCVYQNSSFGNRIDLMAPGEDIYSCAPVNSYKSLTGTSMASPYVAGTAAMMWCVRPSATGAEIKELLRRGAAYGSVVKDKRTNKHRKGNKKERKKYYALLNAEAAMNWAIIEGNNPSSESGWDWQEGSPARNNLKQELEKLTQTGLIRPGLFPADGDEAVWSSDDLTGLLSAVIKDFDGDDIEDLLTIGFHTAQMDVYGRPQNVLMVDLNMYESDLETVTLGDTLSLPISPTVFGMDYGDKKVLAMPEEFSCFYTSGKMGREIVLEYHTDYNGHDTSMMFISYNNRKFSHTGSVGLAETGEPNLFMCKIDPGAELTGQPWMMQCMGGTGSERWDIVSEWYGEDHNYHLTAQEARPLYEDYLNMLSTHNLYGDDSRFSFRWDTIGVDKTDWEEMTIIADKYRNLTVRDILKDGPVYFCSLQNYVSYSGEVQWEQRRTDYGTLLDPYR